MVPKEAKAYDSSSNGVIEAMVQSFENCIQDGERCLIMSPQLEVFGQSSSNQLVDLQCGQVH